MKKNFYLISLLAVCAGVKAQNVGIGTTTPTSKLTVVNAGVGIEHNDGTISIKSVVGGGIAVWGTTSNHPLHLMSNNNTGQLVIMPTGLVGIGNSNPTLAGLVADKKVGAVNAIFGSNTTGVALESNWPGVGFNSYWNGNRKYMASGYGGVIGFNPANGYFTLASTVVSGTANAAATTTDILTATNTGNVGIGTSTPSAKLEVNGTFKLTDGTQGADKVLTSDANGNASWKAASTGNTERFMFQYVEATGDPATGLVSPLYNFGTATGELGIHGSNNREIILTVGKAGLYHIDLSVFFQTSFDLSGQGVATSLSYPYSNYSIQFSQANTPFLYSSGDQNSCVTYNRSFEMYLERPIHFLCIFNLSQPLYKKMMNISGYLISE